MRRRLLHQTGLPNPNQTNKICHNDVSLILGVIMTSAPIWLCHNDVIMGNYFSLGNTESSWLYRYIKVTLPWRKEDMYANKQLFERSNDFGSLTKWRNTMVIPYKHCLHCLLLWQGEFISETTFYVTLIKVLVHADITKHKYRNR